MSNSYIGKAIELPTSFLAAAGGRGLSIKAPVHKPTPKDDIAMSGGGRVFSKESEGGMSPGRRAGGHDRDMKPSTYVADSPKWVKYDASKDGLEQVVHNMSVLASHMEGFNVSDDTREKYIQRLKDEAKEQMAKDIAQYNYATNRDATMSPAELKRSRTAMESRIKKNFAQELKKLDQMNAQWSKRTVEKPGPIYKSQGAIKPFTYFDDETIRNKAAQKKADEAMATLMATLEKTESPKTMATIKADLEKMKITKPKK